MAPAGSCYLRKHCCHDKALARTLFRTKSARARPSRPAYNTVMLDPKPDDRAAEVSYVFINDVHEIERRAKIRRHFWSEDEIVDPWSYAAKRAQGTLRLPIVEYRILQFLASRPNQAISRHRIAAAVSTRRYSVTVESLSRFINSLRDHLGFYSDYIQSVPYIGYRFKA